MGIIITPQIEIDKYFNSDALNQSKLKELLKGFEYFIKEKEERTKSVNMIIGSAVDTTLTGEKEEFNKQYYISELEKKPSDAEMNLINLTFNKCLEETINIGTLEDNRLNLDSSIKEFNWFKGNPGEKRIAGLIERSSEYFEDLKKAYGKQVLSIKENTIITNVVHSFKTHKRTSHFFNKKEDIYKNADVYCQLPVYFDYRGLKCKALLDMVFVFKLDGEITKIIPIDIKTMYDSTINFVFNVKKYRYDIQAAWYIEGLKSHFKVGKEIYPFKFIVESTSYQGEPLVYRMTENLLNIGKYGRKEVILSDIYKNSSTSNMNIPIIKEIKGFDNLIDEYLYYQKDEWKQNKIIAEASGVLELDWNGIVKNLKNEY